MRGLSISWWYILTVLTINQISILLKVCWSSEMFYSMLFYGQSTPFLLCRFYPIKSDASLQGCCRESLQIISKISITLCPLPASARRKKDPNVLLLLKQCKESCFFLNMQKYPNWRKKIHKKSLKKYCFSFFLLLTWCSYCWLWLWLVFFFIPPKKSIIQSK